MHQPASARRTLTFDLPDRSEEAEEDMQVSVAALNQCWEKMQNQVSFHQRVMKASLTHTIKTEKYSVIFFCFFV